MADRKAMNAAFGLLGIVGGLALDAAYVPDLPWTPDAFNLRLVLLNLGSIAVAIGLVRAQPLGAPRALLVAAGIAVVINAWHLVEITRIVAREGQVGPGDYGPLYGSIQVAMWLADLALGVVAARQPGFRRLAAAILALGSALPAAWGLAIEGGPYASQLVPVVLAGVALNGLGWILVGIELAFAPRRGAPASPPSPAAV
jgi:hypothetical protein